jgi:hypothetical protein
LRENAGDDSRTSCVLEAGYRHLAKIQIGIGYKVKMDMPQLTRPEVDALYARGAAWLAGGSL